MVKRFYQVSGIQLFFTGLLVGVVSACLVLINIMVKDYLQLPIVQRGSDGACAAVLNFKNGEAYTCNDLDITLRNYREER